MTSTAEVASTSSPTTETAVATAAASTGDGDGGGEGTTTNHNTTPATTATTTTATTSTKGGGAGGGGGGPPSAVEFEPPLACVRRILKHSLPSSTNVGKDASAAFARASGIFIIYLTACANDFARENRRQTITANDVLAAIKELEFDEFSPELKTFLERYRDVEKKKKEAREKAKAEASYPEYGEGGDDEDDDTTTHHEEQNHQQPKDSTPQSVKSNIKDDDGDHPDNDGKVASADASASGVGGDDATTGVAADDADAEADSSMLMDDGEQSEDDHMVDDGADGDDMEE